MIEDFQNYSLLMRHYQAIRPDLAEPPLEQDSSETFP